MLKEKLLEIEVPFISSTTTLLHLLLELGYNCVKPDRVIMKVSKEIGIVNSEKGEKNLKLATKSLQYYSIITGISSQIIDLYFLVYGKQTGAIKFIDLDK